MKLGSILKSSQEDNIHLGLAEGPAEFLPRYPVESQPEEFIVPQLMNPDIIEGPPNNPEEEVGAVNERMLDYFDENQVSRNKHLVYIFILGVPD